MSKTGSVTLADVKVTSAEGSSTQVFWEYVMVFDIKSEPSERILILKNLRAAGLVFEQAESRDRDEIFVRIGATQERLEKEAERMELVLPLNANETVLSTGAAAFTVEQKDEFRGDNFDDPSKPFFRSSKRQQIIISIIASKYTDGGAGLDYRGLLHKKKVLHFFPLHDFEALKELDDEWAGLDQFKSIQNLPRILEQPIDKVRDYFGEYVAVYFAWLGFYTKCLVPLSLFGFIVLIVQIADEVDNVLVPVYCIFLSLWATFFLEFWKREQATLAWRWNSAGVEEDEPVRPNFQGEKKVSRITGEEEIYYSPLKRAAKLAVSYPLILSILSAVIIATFGILVLRIVLSRTKSMQTIGPLLAGSLNAVSIVILDQLYLYVAYYLNEWENYRTETQFEDNLIAKNFLFQFINSYVSLFYIAYAKSSKPEIFGEQDQCEGSCMQELLIQLGSIFATRMVVQQAMESLVPYFKMKLRTWAETSSTVLDTASSDSDITLEESQSKRERYLNAFDDYNEMIIQFGYVTLFAAAFPVASLLALMNNVIEIRTDAQKLCTSFQRPFYRTVEDIGTYYYILEIMSTVAVMTNCCILAFTSDIFENEGYVEEGDTSKKIWIAVIAEHVILLLKFIINILVPDVPSDVQEAMLAAKFHQEKSMKTQAKKAAENRILQERSVIMNEEFNYEGLVDRTTWLSSR
eukprot:TRINITY_DN359_c0_g6_i1.p1 TRINITY_DN359_c0_g6~~TRINITY_DN359_c0_g6_i1.p1  ORF type:complete len:691 (-),score=174.98 TRINITY_DN359_c0_g6_i1:495-2567(-)